MPPIRFRHIAPLYAIAEHINNRRLARRDRRTGDNLRARLAAISTPAWVEYAEHVPPADTDDLAEVRRWVNPDVLPTPIRTALRGRCSHQRQQLVLRYLQIGSASTYVSPCQCAEARRARCDHVVTTPDEMVRRLPETAWLNFASGEYGGEG